MISRWLAPRCLGACRGVPFATTILLLCCALAHAEGAKSIYQAPVEQAVVPQVVPWALPLDGGRLELLLVAPVGAMRDAAALAERLECAVARVALASRSSAGPDAASWTEELRAALGKNPDAVLLGNVEMGAVPEEAQEALIAAAQGGTGLFLANVLLNGGPLDTFLTGLAPAEAEPALRRGAGEALLQGEKPLTEYLHALAAENVRVAVLDGPGDPPLTHALLPPPPDGAYLLPGWRENAWSAVIRAVRWLARREPAAAIVEMADTSPQGPDEEEIPPDLPQEFVQSMRDATYNLPLHPVSVRLRAPAPRALEALFQLRRRGEAKTAYATVTRVPKGAEAFGTQMLMNAGEFEVDCILRDRKGVVDWRTMPVAVAGWPEAEQVRADKVYLLPNDVLAISARVREVFGVAREGTVLARALDPAGNLLGESMAGVGSQGGSVALTLAFADLLAPMVVVEVYAMEGGPRRFAQVELASSGAEVLRFPVRQLRRGPRFEITLAAPARDEFNARWFLEQWQARGAGAIYSAGGGPAVVRAAELGLALVPALAHVAPAARDNETKPCLSDSAWRAREAERIRDELPAYWAGGGGAYGLGWPAFAADVAPDENPCQSDACIEGFHGWLARHYGDIGVLNRAWGTAYAALDAVPVPDLAACRAAGTPAPWMNWRAYHDEVFAAALGNAAGAIRALDTGGAPGMVALDDTDTRRCYDWPRLLDKIGFVVSPVATLRAPGRGAWGGVTAALPLSEAEGRWLAWSALLAQAPGVWLKDALPDATEGREAPPFDAAGALAPPLAALGDTARAIQGGPGPLVLAAARARSGVALLDGRASRLAADVIDGFGAYGEALGAWGEVLRRAGFMFDVITPREAAGGALEPYRVVILPLALALEKEEAVAIAKFAQAGGALLADVPPGHVSGLGLRGDAPVLDAWFGVRHEGAPAAQSHEIAGQAVQIDVALRGDTAAAKLEGEPPLHWQADGPGQKALLLGYVPPRGAGPWDDAAREFLLANGCARAVEIENTDAAAHLTRARFRYGQAEILAVLAQPDAPEKLEARVAFAEAQHAFDLVAREALARPKKAQLKLAPGGAAVLSLLPYAVEEIAMQGAGIVQQGTRLEFALQVKPRKAEAGDHLVRVTLAIPGAPPLAHYTQIIEAKRGAGNGFIPILQGQAPGHYRLEAADLLSGVTTSHEVKIVGLSVQ